MSTLSIVRLESLSDDSIGDISSALSFLGLSSSSSLAVPSLLLPPSLRVAIPIVQIVLRTVSVIL
jgi:hypothetical protein